MTAVSPWIVRPDLINEAARKAARMYPGVVGEVLSTEILSLVEFSWLGAGSRAARLTRAVTDMEEGNMK